MIVFDKIITSQPSLFMEKLHAYGVTRVVLVPSLLKAIFQILSIIGKAQGRKLLQSVRLWVCSGEAMTYPLLVGTCVFSKLLRKYFILGHCDIIMDAYETIRCLQSSLKIFLRNLRCVTFMVPRR